MLQAACNVQVVEGQPTEMLRSNRHAYEFAMMLYSKEAHTPAVIGARVMRQVAGETGNALKVPKIREEDLCVKSCDVRNHLELLGT